MKQAIILVHGLQSRTKVFWIVGTQHREYHEVKLMTLEELKKLKDDIWSIAVEPPWCSNIDALKAWVEGFETCQGQITAMIDSKIKNVDPQR